MSTEVWAEGKEGEERRPGRLDYAQPMQRICGRESSVLSPLPELVVGLHHRRAMVKAMESGLLLQFQALVFERIRLILELRYRNGKFSCVLALRFLQSPQNPQPYFWLPIPA